jgi:hypothetical protein
MRRIFFIFCNNCGKEIPDSSKFCPFCGKPVETTAATETSAADTSTSYPPSTGATYDYPDDNTYVYHDYHALCICACIFGVLGGFVGLVLGIIGLCLSDEDRDRTLCWIGIVFFIVWLIISIVAVLSTHQV